ncbi:MAG: hypothetical protein A3E85_03195 [Gammaproteobacteria bacterium RIFCSPHIGHO2_12_FULL_45_12]|nr:MAG: hypothetical protein A3E85_03195 [Gammaproteobacteria bacterium RIFCSPHIGHO2_12_FULL_45_12]
MEVEQWLEKSVCQAPFLIPFERIRAIREKKGYSQEEFAAAAQPGRSYAGRAERGEQNISMPGLIQIALTLEVEVGELFPSHQELRAPYRKRLEGKTS